MTPEMIAAGWRVIWRNGWPRFGPGPGLAEAYEAMREHDPRALDVATQVAKAMSESLAPAAFEAEYRRGVADGRAVVDKRLAAKHALDLEQCSIFVDSPPLKESMTHAAALLRKIAEETP